MGIVPAMSFCEKTSVGPHRWMGTAEFPSNGNMNLDGLEIPIKPKDHKIYGMNLEYYVPCNQYFSIERGVLQILNMMIEVFPRKKVS